MADVAGEAVAELVDASVHNGSPVRRYRHVPVLGIPRLVALEEQHVVPAGGHLPHQRAVRGRVSVAPRRRDREAEDDEGETIGPPLRPPGWDAARRAAATPARHG